MSSSSQNSFIPKRGPVKLKPRSSQRQVYIFTYVAYVFIIAALLSAVGVFFYKSYIESQLAEAVSELNQAIANFDEREMERIKEFDGRLTSARNRLEGAVSVSSLLTALEQSTAASVRYVTLRTERAEDSHLTVELQVETDSLDSVIFQREVFESNELVSKVEIDQVNLADQSAEETREGDEVAPPVVYAAVLTVPLESVGYEPTNFVPSSRSTLPSAASLSSEVNTEATTTQSSNDNQENL